MEQKEYEIAYGNRQKSSNQIVRTDYCFLVHIIIL